MSSDVEMLFREWDYHTTGANVHNMKHLRLEYLFAAGQVTPKLNDPELAQSIASEMRSHLAGLKLAKLRGTFYRVP